MNRLLTLGAIFISSFSDGWEECCPRKQVGDFFYNYKGVEDTSEYPCVSECVYSREADPDAENRYCFAPGNLTYVCDEKPKVSYQCDRDCVTSKPYTCVFNLTLEMLKTDADGRRADGRLRSVLAYNHTIPGSSMATIPGPQIVICEGDTLVVNFLNNITGNLTNADGSSNTTTLHFHGIREKFKPWVDGVPFVTQSPLLPGENFTYGFNTDVNGAPPGTYWYHSHVGAQRNNGAYGALVIKENRTDDRFDVDDANNTLVLQEWYESSTNQTPVSILINGNGRVGERKLSGGDEEILKHLQGKGGNFHYVQNEDYTGIFTSNYSEFQINEPGKSYRFRVIGAVSQNFPLRLSIDGHKFTAIGADSRDIESVHDLTDLTVAAGERYNIVVQTKSGNTTGTAYKIRVFGYSNPNERKYDENHSPPLCSIAWLKYPGQTIDYSYVTPYNCAGFDLPSSRRSLNPAPNNYTAFKNRIQLSDWKNNSTTGDIFVVDLRSVNETSELTNIGGTPWNTQYIEFGGNFTFNGKRMNYSYVPFLLQDPANDTYRCGAQCTKHGCIDIGSQFNVCNHVMEQPWFPQLGNWAEIVLINNQFFETAAHPIHQHGGWYWVVGMGKYDTSDPKYSNGINRTYIMEQDRNCTNGNYCLPRNFVNPPAKDTLQIPQNGYAIIRTPLDNAGAWIFHCHINFHTSIGMVMVLQIGKFEDWRHQLGPLKVDVNKVSKTPPPPPLGQLGGPAFISWFLYMDHAVRCVKPGEPVTFYFIFGHTVNVLSWNDWDTCNVTGVTQVFPEAGVSVANNPTYGFHVFKTTVSGTYHLACGVGGGYHCNHGMKAKITVSNFCPY